jgi:hypothetical protein
MARIGKTTIKVIQLMTDQRMSVTWRENMARFATKNVEL